MIASSQLSSSTWGATIAGPWAKPGAGWAGRVKGMGPWVCCCVCVHTFVVLELAQPVAQPVALPVDRKSATFKKFTRNSRSRIPLALPLALTRPATGYNNNTHTHTHNSTMPQKKENKRRRSASLPPEGDVTPSLLEENEQLLAGTSRQRGRTTSSAGTRTINWRRNWQRRRRQGRRHWQRQRRHWQRQRGRESCHCNIRGHRHVSWRRRSRNVSRHGQMCVPWQRLTGRKCGN